MGRGCGHTHAPRRGSPPRPPGGVRQGRRPRPGKRRSRRPPAWAPAPGPCPSALAAPATDRTFLKAEATRRGFGAGKAGAGPRLLRDRAGLLLPPAPQAPSGSPERWGACHGDPPRRPRQDLPALVFTQPRPLCPAPTTLGAGSAGCRPPAEPSARRRAAEWGAGGCPSRLSLLPRAVGAGRPWHLTDPLESFLPPADSPLRAEGCAEPGACRNPWNEGARGECIHKERGPPGLQNLGSLWRGRRAGQRAEAEGPAVGGGRLGPVCQPRRGVDVAAGPRPPRPCEHSDGAPRGPAGDVAESPSLSPTRAGRARGRPAQARRASVHREPGSPGAVAGPPPPWATSRTVTDNGVAVPVDSAVAGGPGAGAAGRGGCGLEVTSPRGSAGLGAASPPGTSPSPDPPACRVPGTERRAAGGGRRRWACRRGSSGRAWRCADTRPCFRNVQDLSFSSPLTLHISSKKSLPRGGGFSIWALWMSYFGGNLCVNSFPSPSSCGDN